MMGEAQNSAREGLTQTEADGHRRHGFAGPFTLCSPKEARERAESVRRQVLTRPGPASHRVPGMSRHFDDRTTHELCTHPAILDRVTSIYGPDILLWRSNYFLKEPSGTKIPWHQDDHYWPIYPRITVTAWIALDAANLENGCVQVIPGSHKTPIPVRPVRKQRYGFGEVALVSREDQAKAVPILCRAGEFFLFAERLLHGSRPNLTDRPRLGLAARFTIPSVKVYSDEHFDPNVVLLVRGEDRCGFNVIGHGPDG